MKKLSIIILAITIALCTASCTKNNPQSTPNSQSLPSSQGGTQNEAGEEYLGKISSVAGNELTLDLAKIPGEEQVPPPVNSSGEMMAVPMMPATAATAAGEGGSDGAATRIEVEYTGESKDFTVPAGVEIVDTTGATKQLDELKKGALLNVKTDKDGNITQVLYIG